MDKLNKEKEGRRNICLAFLFGAEFGGVDRHFSLLLADDHSSHALSIQEEEGLLVNIAPFSGEELLPI